MLRVLYALAVQTGRVRACRCIMVAALAFGGFSQLAKGGRTLLCDGTSVACPYPSPCPS